MPEGLTKTDRAWVAKNLALAESVPPALRPPKRDSVAGIRIEMEGVAAELEQLRLGLEQRTSRLRDSVRLEDVLSAVERQYGPGGIEHGWRGEPLPHIWLGVTLRRANGRL